ncbi:MAG: NOP5/NOP56 family protein [Candidatus Micrarchaeaceae archaeon]
MKKESFEERRKRLLNAAKEAVGSAYASDEKSIIQAINAYFELDKLRNMLFERLEEWYSLHFPELSSSNQNAYAKFIVEFGGDKKAATEGSLAKIFGGKAKEVYAAIAKSIGSEPSANEYAQIKGMASAVLQIADLQKSIDKFIEERSKSVMPNLTYLIDYKVAAQLLSKAGSLSKLAMMPASTIQLLGAEKALFKHLKFRSKAPKYGYIFKLPQVMNAQKDQKGRMARIVAAKLAIASRADAFSKHFIADKLKAEIEKAVSSSGQKEK